LPRIVCASRRTIPTTMQERTRNGNYRIAAVCVCLQSMYSVDQKPSSSFLLLQHFEYGRKWTRNDSVRKIDAEIYLWRLGTRIDFETLKIRFLRETKWPTRLRAEKRAERTERHFKNLAQQ
jgi:hypothetical protein